MRSAPVKTLWLSGLPIGVDGLFVKPSPEVLVALGQASEWAIAEAYEPVAAATFAEGADCYLIAHALAGGHDVVTQEVASASKKRVKIPNACIGLGIRWPDAIRDASH